ncbi:hypothetical protein AB0M43_23585 [Longispora sp. NPDC051575]|uniref:hypothetical protein n=1 Tax=Longispora sp. NPDC051575 TaxID=3154943 RepID=UPI00344848B2
MDPELVALASAAGTTVVGLLATDAWQLTRTAMGSLWRRVWPQRAEALEAELVDVRAELLAAHAVGDTAAAQALVGEWQGRLRRLLAADPQVADELRRLLREDLAVPTGDRAWTDDVLQEVTASGQSRVNVVGQGSMTVHES